MWNKLTAFKNSSKTSINEEQEPASLVKKKVKSSFHINSNGEQDDDNDDELD